MCQRSDELGRDMKICDEVAAAAKRREREDVKICEDICEAMAPDVETCEEM